MKNLICILVITFCASINSINAQFKLKTLDNVVVSMNSDESLTDYSKYLSSYFSRFDLLNGITNTKNFELRSKDENGKIYLQGNGSDVDGNSVVFRIAVQVSQDGKTITKIDSGFDIEMCTAKSCTACVFLSDGGCQCTVEGDCNHSISLKEK